MALRDIIEYNFWFKLLAVALATVIWFVIRGSQDLSGGQPVFLNPLQENETIPVTVLTHPADARIYQITPKTVMITVTGERAVLQKYSKKDYRAYVDLTESRNKEPSIEETVKIHVPSE